MRAIDRGRIHGSRQATAALLVGALVSAAAALWLVLPLVVTPGQPAFQHDWTWPFVREEKLWTGAVLLSAWNPDGLGGPNSELTINPLHWLQVGLAFLLSTKAALVTYLFLTFFVQSAAMYGLLLLEFECAMPAACFGALTFVSGALGFAKLAAGQIGYLAATAAFVVGLCFMLRALRLNSRRAALVAGLCFSLATLQLQFLVFAIVAVGLAALVYRSRSALKLLAISFVGAFVLALPKLVALLSLGPAAGADISRPYLSWQLGLSSSPLDATALLGYTALYTERALFDVGPWALLYHVVTTRAILAAVLVALALWRTRKTVWLFLMAACGFLWITGFKGPAGPLWEWYFNASSSSGYFREFFHGAILLVFPAAVAAALLVDFMLRRFNRIGRFLGGAGALAVLGGTGFAVWSLGFLRVVPLFVAPAYLHEIPAEVPKADGRAFFFPARRPLYAGDDKVGGNDAFDWAGERQLSLYAFTLPEPTLALEEGLERADPSIVRALGPRIADCVIVRKNLHVLGQPDLFANATAALTKAGYEPEPLSRDAPLAVLHDAFPLLGSAGAAHGFSSDLSDSVDPRAVYLDRPGVDAGALLDGMLAAPDPSLGWIRARDATPSGYMHFGASAGLVTTRAGALLRLPAGGRHSISIFAPAGADLNGRRIVSPGFKRFYFSGDTADVRAGGFTAISELGSEPYAAAPGSSADLREIRVTPTEYSGSVTVRGRALIVLRQAYSEGWALHDAGLATIAHVRADGFANAWEVEGRGSSAFRIVYEPQSAARAWLLISALLFLAYGAALFPARLQEPA